jgi:hypothetical protein
MHYLLEHPKINYLKYVDLDEICFMMFTKDLQPLFEIMARLGLG